MDGPMALAKMIELCDKCSQISMRLAGEATAGQGMTADETLAFTKSVLDMSQPLATMLRVLSSAIAAQQKG